MPVKEPIYRFVSQAGKFGWLYTAIATWLLGFATWQVLYLIYSTAPSPALPPGVPGPNSFVSVLLGDGLALPVLNALIVHFYTVYSRTVYSRLDMHVADESVADENVAKKEPRGLGGGIQGVLALVFAAAACIGTYASWFAAGKVDWTIPKPGMLNFAGVYHAMFVTVETYFVFNFALSVGRILIAYKSRKGDSAVSTSGGSGNGRKERAVAFIPLLCLLGGSWLAGDVFFIGLLVDGLRATIPLTSFESGATANLVVMSAGILGMLMIVYRSQLRTLLRSPIAILILFFAVCGSAIPLMYVSLWRH